MRTIMTAFLLLASVSAFATPSTLVNIPSTDIQPTGVWHLGTDIFVPKSGDTSIPTVVDAGLTYGVTPRLEVGIDAVSGFANKQLVVWGNAKYLVLDAAQSPVPVAVGIYNAGPLKGANQQIAYAVGSYTTKVGPRLTFGGYSANKDVIAGGDSKDAKGYMAGVDYTIKKVWLGVDYLSGKNAVGAVSYGVGFNFTDKAGVILGYNHFNSSAVANTVNIQYDINF